MNEEAVAALLLLETVMVAGNYAARSIRAYAREVKFFLPCPVRMFKKILIQI
jgi:hypothetical protein